MTGTRPADILRHLKPPGRADRELVAAFARHRDPAAFAELVRRHGPVVWAACRRVAGHREDAEDAFQAAFLVLVRRAGSVGNPDLLGNWLYGVAVRVALRARRSAARRRKREAQVPTMPDPPSPAPEPTPDLGPVLDEALAALPGHYREAIVLCDLRGTSREEAAKLLGVPEGTLSSRLANGRKKLAVRLLARGVTLSVAAVPGVLGNAARAAVPTELVARVYGLATGTGASAAVARLAAGGYSVKTIFLVGTVCAAAAAGVVYGARPADPPQAEPPKPAAVGLAAPVPPPKDDPAAFTTAPKMRVGRDLGIKDVGAVAWSPDGKRLAVQGTDESLAAPPAAGPDVKGGGPPGGPRAAPKLTGNMVYVVEFGDAGVERAGRAVGAFSPIATLVGFTPVGDELVTDQREYGLVSGFHQLHYHTFAEPKEPPAGRFDPPGRRTLARTRAPVDLDASDTQGYYFAPDGKTFRTVASERDGTGVAKRIDIREVDAATGKTLKSLMKVDTGPYALSPDGLLMAVVEKGAKVVVYEVGRAAKVSEYALPESPAPAAPAVPAKGRNAPGGGDREPRARGDREPATYLRFSPDRRLLAVARDVDGSGPAGEVMVGQTVVLDAGTGKPLPPLDGGNMMRAVPGRHAFTSDGRLLAMAGTRYEATTRRRPDGFEQTALNPRGDFLTVWDTRTGKVVKSWDRAGTMNVAFHPTRPVLAILEPNGDDQTRLGLWDFAAEVPKK